MLGHLEEAVKLAIGNGTPQDDAYDLAIASFGSTKNVRRRIVRDTYGDSPHWFLIGFIFTMIGFVTSLYMNMRFMDVIPATFKPIPTPQWVMYLKYPVPMSSSSLAGLSVLNAKTIRSTRCIGFRDFVYNRLGNR